MITGEIMQARHVINFVIVAKSREAIKRLSIKNYLTNPIVFYDSSNIILSGYSLKSLEEINLLKNLMSFNGFVFIQKRKSIPSPNASSSKRQKKLCKFHLVHISEIPNEKTKKKVTKLLKKSLFFKIARNTYLIPTWSTKVYEKFKMISPPLFVLHKLRRLGLDILIIPSLVPINGDMYLRLLEKISNSFIKEFETELKKAKKLRTYFKENREPHITMRKLKILFRNLKILKEKAIILKKITGKNYKKFYNKVYVYLIRLKKDIEIYI